MIKGCLCRCDWTMIGKLVVHNDGCAFHCYVVNIVGCWQSIRFSHGGGGGGVGEGVVA